MSLQEIHQSMTDKQTNTLPVISPENSPLFARWRDPVSGVESLILSRRAAPLQQSFYFVNPSFSSDGRYLWFYCRFVPSDLQLAVADLAAGEIRQYPETQFLDASPFVIAATGDVYWAQGLDVWRRGPLAKDQATLVNSFPAELANNRRPWRLATHLTLSADGKSFAIDAQIGNQWFIGDLPLDSSQPFRLWQTFDDCCYNHAQFSPTDPDLMLIAQDGWNDAATGKPGKTQDRLWLIRRGEKARAILPDAPLSSDRRGHEWWDADGQHVWYIDYRAGTERVNILTGRRENIWPSGHTHSHCDRGGQYLVGDICPGPDDAWSVAFFNIHTGKEINIVSRLPAPPYPRRRFHIHPHPQFCRQDRYICYTTNVLGPVDVALVSVDQLVERTR
jgi:hypothetical protein